MSLFYIKKLIIKTVAQKAEAYYYIYRYYWDVITEWKSKKRL